MNHTSQCRVCAYGVDRIDWSLSSRKIAEIVDCGKTSVLRHIKWAEANGFEGSQKAVVTGKTVGADGFPESPVPGEWVPRRHWETPNGEVLNSFEFKPSDTDVEHLVDNERIDALIRGLDSPKRTFNLSNEALPGAQVLVIADPQLGKAGEAMGGTPGTIERIYAAVESAVDSWGGRTYSEIILVDAGDIIENCFSTPSQIATNDRTLPQQIEDAVAVYMNVIRVLLEHCERLTYVAVTSNHGEARTAMKVNPYDSENDWGLMIQRMVQARCEDRGWDVGFERPSEGEDTAVVTTLRGTMIAVNHGHHSGTPANVKKWVTGQIVGRRPGWDADIWILGHYHHFYTLPVGKDTTVIGCPAIDPGSAWFTKKTGEAFPPSLLGFYTANGQWSNLNLYR